MPNWCSNTIYIDGSQETITKILRELEINDNTFSLSALYPIPKKLQDLVLENAKHGIFLFTWKETKEAITEDSKILSKIFLNQNALIGYHMGDEGYAETDDPLLKEIQPVKLPDDYFEKLEDLYGARSAYGWCINNYGTKWDAEAHNWQCSPNKDRIVAHMDTAWSPPIEWAKHVSRDWDVDVEVHFVEPGMQFYGSCFAKDGNIQEKVELDTPIFLETDDQSYEIEINPEVLPFLEEHELIV